ncbi:MAG: DUF4340 domain-containing protein [Myxococcota bacterium]
MQRSLVVHTVLALVAVVAAYAAWTKPAASSDSTIVMVPGSAERLTSIQWKEERWNVTVSRQDGAVEVSVQRLNPPKKTEPTDDAAAPDAAKPDEPKVDVPQPEDAKLDAPKADEPQPEDAKPVEVEPPEPPDPPKVYPGSTQAIELFDKLAPLEAARSLGKLAAERLKALGLDEPKSTLTLSIGNSTHTLEIGNSTYGSGDMYVQKDGGEVFLVASRKLSSLRHGASTLIDRNVAGVKKEDVERLAVTGAGKGREIVQRFAEDKAKAFWADPAEPDAKLELVGNWLDRVLRLRVVDLVDETPAGPPSIEMEFFAGAKSLSTIKIWPAGDRTALCTSSRFKKTLTISKANAEAIIRDLENVLSEGQ